MKPKKIVGQKNKKVKIIVVIKSIFAYFDLKLRIYFMEWIYICIAGLLEIAWAIGLKYTEGWTKILPNIWTITTMVLSFYFLSKGLKDIPVGTAYAVWTGIGAAGTAILGIILFHESRDIGRLFFIFLIISGIIGLKIKS